MARVTALDIGGANIKGLGPYGAPILRPFELWRRPEKLAEVLSETLSPLLPLDWLLVTMTGELCDCFETKADGVRRILRSIRSAVSGKRGLRVRVWRTDQRFVSMEEAIKDPIPSAAANWLALALLAGRFAPEGHALLVDIGSTTTDIIVLKEGRPAPKGLTDTERLLSRELVYTGVARTPVAAVVRDLPYRGELCPVAAELFATTLDAYLVLGQTREAPADRNTADRRPATKAWARDRLARMLGADRETFTEADARAAAAAIKKAQIGHLKRALGKVLEAMGTRPTAVVISGSGEFLARRALAGLHLPIVSLEEKMGSGLSTVAPAYALTVLAQEDQGVEGEDVRTPSSRTTKKKKPV